MRLARQALLLCTPAILSAQLVDTKRPSRTDALTKGSNPTAVCSGDEHGAAFERAIAELTKSGVVQASSELFRLCIGDPAPNAFRLPVYFFVGATDPAGAQGDEKALASLLNPLGGNVNLAIVHDLTLWHVAPDAANRVFTKLSLAYQVSGKYVTGTDAKTPSTKIGTAAGFGDIGLRYQTFASNLSLPTDSTGVFWAQAKFAVSGGSKPNLQRIFGDSATSTLPTISGDLGVDVVMFTLKASFQKVIKDHHVEAWKGWNFRFGLDIKPQNTGKTP